ncbi:MAG: Gfo/Idh/MocA family protein [Spirochaetota bacterium]
MRCGFSSSGSVDPSPDGCRRLGEVKEAVGAVHSTLDDFLVRGTADLTVVSAPIHRHADLTVRALEHGSHVLCEKPVGGSLDDLKRMKAAERSTGLSVAIGFQWSFSRAIERIRAHAAEGRFGAPRRFRSLSSWPRGLNYYARAAWAGRVRLENGTWVRDSPVNNATAHYLHNMLFVLERAETAGLRVDSVSAELYRANAIESFDTAALRVVTEAGTEVLVYTTHAGKSVVEPMTVMEFDDAVVRHQCPGSFVAVMSGGHREDYGNPDTGPREKLERVVSDIRSGRRPACTLDDASHQLLVACSLDHDSGIVDFPSEIVERTNGVWVSGVTEALVQAYANGVLPHELGNVDWARPAR